MEISARIAPLAKLKNFCLVGLPQTKNNRYCLSLQDSLQEKTNPSGSNSTMTNTDIWMISLTALIAVAGVISATIFNKQLSVMQGQLDENESDWQTERNFD